TLPGVEMPKVFYTVTHGHERYATYAGALFFKELCERWKNDEVVRMLRWNVHFIVVPNCNPWGFNNNSRLNYNGVDLARNYPAGWSPNYSDINYDYPGTEPLSEVATQVIYDILENNKDAFFAIDHHNFLGDPYQSRELIWTASLDSDVRNMLSSYIHNMIVYTKKISDLDEGAQLGRLSDNPAGGSLARQFDSMNIKGTLLECLNEFNHDNQAPIIQRLNMEFLGNAVLTAIRYYIN